MSKRGMDDEIGAVIKAIGERDPQSAQAGDGVTLRCGWQQMRVDHVTEEERTMVDPASLGDEVVFHYSIPAIQEYGDGLEEPASEIASQKLSVRDEVVLVSKLNPDQGVVLTARPRCAITVASSEFVALRPKGIDHRFLLYLFMSHGVRANLVSRTQSATKSHRRAKPDDIKKTWFALPPGRDQLAIANYLDAETARIDALIDRKQRFIDLLLEKRTALITHAVTKGLDSDVEMKDSGVEWIGAIPSYWQMGRLKDLAPYVTSGSRGWAQFYADDGPLFLRITNLPRGSIDLNMRDLRNVDVPAGAEGARTQVRPGDVLVSITAEMGAVGVAPEGLGEAYVSQHVALSRPRAGVNSRWLAYVMSSRVGCEHYENRLYGGTKIQLSLDDVRETPIPIPPPSDREAISKRLDAEAARLDSIVSRIGASIALLREYRTALISAAVTGQIDIPGTETSEDVA